jgi:hypothetical protein
MRTTAKKSSGAEKKAIEAGLNKAHAKTGKMNTMKSKLPPKPSLQKRGKAQMSKANRANKTAEPTLATVMKEPGVLLSKRSKEVMHKCPKSVTITRGQFAKFVESTIAAMVLSEIEETEHHIYWMLAAIGWATVEHPVLKKFAPIAHDIFDKETP